MQPIHLSFPFTLADRIRLSFALIPHSPRAMVFAAVFPLLALCFVAFLAFMGRPLDAGAWMLVGCLLAFYPVMVVVGVTLTHLGNKALREPFDYRFDERGIHINAVSYEYTHRWAAILRVRRSRRFLFFFFAPSCAHCIPLAAIERAGGIAPLRALAREHGVAIPDA